MKNYEIPVKNILKYSFVFSLTVSLITFVSSFMHEEYWSSVVYRVSSTFVLFYIFSLLNLYMLKRFYKQNNLADSYVTINDKRQYLCGLMTTAVVFFGTHLFSVYLINCGIISPAFMRNELSKLGPWLYVFLFLLSAIAYTVVYFLHNFIILQDSKVKVDLENSELRTRNAETANQLLRQQIQPHFLFNALNVLKSLIRKYPDTAEEYLISLSDFLRASVNQNKKVLVPLDEELKICKDYMEMQKIRFGEALIYKVNMEDNLHGYLPVFSLQPLLENAIKHNELTNLSPLEIHISRVGDWVEVKNNIKPKRSLGDSTGNGLSNLAERYRLLSGDSIKIDDTKECFRVRIKILENA
jgi:two-component system LytT family sensor kinase